MKLNVKIGGCEARNDIFFCSNLKVDSIVAPMVESSYALKKFIQVVPKEYLGNLFINLESKTAFNNKSSRKVSRIRIERSPSNTWVEGIEFAIGWSQSGKIDIG